MSPASYFLMTLGIFLSFPLLSKPQNYNTFMEKHIVQDKANINCNTTIKDRNLRNRNECRRHNTFIHDTSGKTVKELCSKIVESTVVSSKEPLPLTDCILQKGSRQPPQCAYNQTSTTGIIYITCENHLPVHFVKFQPNIGVSCSPCALIVMAFFLMSQFLL